MQNLRRLFHRACARDAAVFAVLTALNAYVALNLFLTEYLSHMESIEAAYIGISRYILDHGFNLDWFPLWYAGVPFQNTYPPLLHLLVAGASWALGISPAHAHHVTVAAIYCLAALLVYALTKRLAGDWRVGAAAAALFSIVSPSAFLAPSVRSWSDWTGPARFLSIINFGDGPHVASVALIPLAILAIHAALESGGLLRIYLAALACASVVLTNWLGAFGLALALASYLLARAALGRVTAGTLGKVSAIALLAYGSAMPWIPPSTISRIQYNAQFVIGQYALTRAHLIYIPPIVAAAALLWWACRKFRVSLAAGFACFFALFSTTLVAAADYLELFLMPQPHRYHHEMDLAWSIVLACGAAAVLRRLDRRAATIAMVAALLGGVFLTKQVRRRARVAVGPIQIESTVEHRTAIWLRENLPERRVFATGSIQFWLNAFSDNPQVGGGFGQGIVNSTIPVVHFGVPWTMGDGAETAAWLKLYGAAAVVVSGPGSRDSYWQNWRDPAKFRGVLDEVYRDGGDVIYRVPLRSDSFAHVVPATAIVRRAPINNADLDPVRPLLRALDDPALSLVRMDCAGPGDCTIGGEVHSGQVLFMQVSYHRGWSATVNGSERPIERDGLGFMTIDPQCAGACEVRLKYDGGAEMAIAKAVSLGCLGVGVFGMGWSVVSRRNRRTGTIPVCG